ncbi:carbamate kinase [Baekduia soli]|uniref:Carbamate kinase n=1 Tax=Baekduia soli TaxID=496014 RepID=A0A5B8U5G3_9ACTN|nr:carbamate kinase [Baekduia soli]QEC48323.1 carbamate kinase [Baekduia soli]
MRVVLALGGNALIRRGQPADAEAQRRNVAVAARSIAEVVRAGHEVVVTHGNGPQVGLLALQSAAYPDVRPYPLDVLGAESEGMIGYLLEQALRNERVAAPVATLLTQVVVDPADPAFAAPTKPIGPVYDAAHGAALARDRGWTLAPDGDGVRRVVASPEPQEILELETIRLLTGAGVVVVCAGGGGIPVAVSPDGLVTGVEAVVDKDLAAALLARRLDADLLVLLTDVPGVVLDWGTEAARVAPSLDVAVARSLQLAAGSMGPKVEAACRFADATGRRAAIGAMESAGELVAGSAGTMVRARIPAGVA